MSATGYSDSQVSALHYAGQYGYVREQNVASGVLDELERLDLLTVERDRGAGNEQVGKLTDAGTAVEAMLAEPDIRPWPEGRAPFQIPSGAVPSARLLRLVQEIRAGYRTWGGPLDSTHCSVITEAEVLQLVEEVLAGRMAASLEDAE